MNIDDLLKQFPKVIARDNENHWLTISASYDGYISGYANVNGEYLYPYNTSGTTPTEALVNLSGVLRLYNLLMSPAVDGN